MARYYKYPPERLAEVAAEASSMNDVLTRLGLPQLGGYHTHISRQIRKFGIDISHFGTAKYAGGKRSIDPEVFRRAVAESQSIAAVARALGMSRSGSSSRQIHAWSVEHDVDLGKMPGQGHSRGKSLPRRTAQDLLQHRPESVKRANVALLRRALSDIGRPYHCTICGVGEAWNGRPLILEVDHISGDWRDNRAENLRYLCPNCHSQTDSFCGRNRAANVAARQRR
ncbi:HNH endonuclease signature motif containing protein [Uniformispora flossi]|uniref:HNH endonuclease signature motif containing protein n=1 Tax=Uniformispora flossi TaxID=3390723 RepID=UPI003C2FACCE